MKIIGISGRKQAGKNTVANILHGIALKNNSLIKDWNVGPDGELMILTEDDQGQEGWGEFDITRKDEQFTQYAEHSMWPYVKLYSFADRLKWICTELFDIPKECAWGTEEQKNQTQEHLLWENLPIQKEVSLNTGRPRQGVMTSREFMQFLGTNVMRKIYDSVWVNSTIKKITREQSELAVIADVRFPNEAKAIENAGGVVVRLTRKVSDDNHDSEVALDGYPFKHFIDNKDGSLDSMAVKVSKFFRYIQEN